MIHFNKENLEDILPLTAVQEGILFHHLDRPGSGEYLQQTMLRIIGKLDANFFRVALNHVVQENEGLRSVFRWENLNRPVQIILKKHDPEITFLNESVNIADLLLQDSERGIDIQNHPLRLLVVSHSGQQHSLICSFHHILLDGWSFGMLIRNLLTNYNSLNNGNALIRKTPTKGTVKAYLSYIQNRNKNEDEIFWKENLKSFVRKISSPFQSTPKEMGTGRLSAPINLGLGNKIYACARKGKVSTASVYYAAWALLLYRSTRASAITFGTTTSGRPKIISKINDSIGFFINTLPFHLVINSKQDIRGFLKSINSMTIAMVEHEFASIQEIKKYGGIASTDRLFNSLCVIENYPLHLDEKFDDLTVESFEIYENTNYDIALSVLSFNLDKSIHFSYKNARFTKQSIDEIANYLIGIIESIADSNDQTLIEDIGSPAQLNDQICAALNNNSIYESVETQTSAAQENVEIGKKQLGEKASSNMLISFEQASILDTVAKHKTEFDDSLLNHLLRICSQVLGLKNVKPSDNFFTIGGDSIKAIRLMSLVRKAGYSINMREIFGTPIIGELSLVIKRINLNVNLDRFEGKTGLNAIQSNFFNVNEPSIDRYNQAVILEFKQDVSWDVLKEIFQHLTEHYDVFRLRFQRDGPEIQSFYERKVLPSELVYYDLRGVVDEGKRLEDAMNEMHGSLNIEQGLLAKFGVIMTGKRTLLAVVMHHLIVDGVSWRILLEDLNTLFSQHKAAKTLEISGSPSSFGRYVNSLHELIKKGYFDLEATYWERVNSRVTSKLFDAGDKQFTYKEFQRVSKTLTIEYVGKIENINRKLGTNTNEVLIASLGLAIKKVFEVEDLTINLEGHGRTEFDSKVDVSKTIGWFTSLYPIAFDFRQSSDLICFTRKVKENIRSVPNNGEGFGILKYLLGKEFRHVVPEISFNYLGDFSSLTETDFFKASMDTIGSWYSPDTKIQHPVEVFSLIDTNDEMTLTADFISAIVREDKIRSLLNLIYSNIVEIEEACSKIEGNLKSPSDFTFAEIKLDTLDKILNNDQLKDIYELSPTQEGLLHYGKLSGNKNDYVVNSSVFITGQISYEILNRSYSILVDRHDVLRTTFNDDLGVGRTLQLVKKKHQAGIRFEQLDTVAADERDSILNQLDREGRGAVNDIFSNETNAKLFVVKLAEHEYKLTLYYHHILLDGWSVVLLLNELINTYNLLQRNKDPYSERDSAPPFNFYIKWLRKKDNYAASEYWRIYLQDFNEAFKFRVNSKSDRHKDDGYITTTIDQKDFVQMQSFALEAKSTLYNYIQAIWAMLLLKLSGNRDLVFGQVVSGRPDIELSDQLVGLFINTVPKRIRIEEGTSFMELVRSVSEDELAALPYQYYSLADIQTKTPIRDHLFSHIIVFENQYQLLELEKKNDSNDLSIGRYEGNDPNHYEVSVLFSQVNETLKMELRFDKNKYDLAYFTQVIKDFEHLIHVTTRSHNNLVEQILIDADRGNGFTSFSPLNSKCFFVPTTLV